MAIVVKIPALVEKVIKHTSEVCSYVLIPQKRCPKYKPGQFLHLAIDPYDPSFQWPESRVFSIANSPTRNDTIVITFAMKGQYTKRMYEEIREGDVIWLKLPYGYFTFNDCVENAMILIAGGTGITPFISFIEYAVDMNIDKIIKLYYGVRSEKLLIYDNVISEWDNKLHNFSEVIFIENITSRGNNNYRKGILDIKQIYQETKQLKKVDYYLSGPIEMINSFKSFLIHKKISESSIHFDKWE